MPNLLPRIQVRICPCPWIASFTPEIWVCAFLPKINRKYVCQQGGFENEPVFFVSPLTAGHEQILKWACANFSWGMCKFCSFPSIIVALDWSPVFFFFSDYPKKYSKSFRISKIWKSTQRKYFRILRFWKSTQPKMFSEIPKNEANFLTLMRKPQNFRACGGLQVKPRDL